jgi:hypothetical protein
LLGKVLARAHNASGADIKGWVNGRDERLLDNLADFSQSYSRQVESDYREFTAKYPPAPPSEGKKKMKDKGNDKVSVADNVDGFFVR